MSDAERTPRDFSHIVWAENGRLPSVDAVTANFRHHAIEAAQREFGGVVVYIARVRDGKVGEGRVRVGAVAYGELDFLGAILTAVSLTRDSGVLRDSTIRQLARQLRELTNVPRT